MILHKRGSIAEFEAGARLAKSADTFERQAGIAILGQLGCGDRTFLEESLPLLIAALADSSDDVVADAAIALGHRHDPRAIPALIALKNHASESVRYGVVVGLSAHDEEAAIATLIELSADPDTDVRDWATFGLAQQIGTDSAAVREALYARLTDEDPETRGEALIGLAIRRDERVRPAIARELAADFEGGWAVEAAEILADPQFYPLLKTLRERLCPDDRAHFASTFANALAACQPENVHDQERHER
jgi:HEAT repeat protein